MNPGQGAATTARQGLGTGPGLDLRSMLTPPLRLGFPHLRDTKGEARRVTEGLQLEKEVGQVGYGLALEETPLHTFIVTGWSRLPAPTDLGYRRPPNWPRPAIRGQN